MGWLEGEGEPQQPVLEVKVNEEVSSLGERLPWDDCRVISKDLDVTFRFQSGPEDKEGVMAISNRLTGEFILEVNAGAVDVMEFVSAVHRYAERTNGDARFRTQIIDENETLVDLEKRTLLVYAENGELLRKQSLIPSGVEI